MASLLESGIAYPVSIEQVARDLEQYYRLQGTSAEEAIGLYILYWRGRSGAPTVFAYVSTFPPRTPISLADACDRLLPKSFALFKEPSAWGLQYAARSPLFRPERGRNFLSRAWHCRGRTRAAFGGGPELFTEPEAQLGLTGLSDQSDSGPGHPATDDLLILTWVRAVIHAGIASGVTEALKLFSYLPRAPLTQNDYKRISRKYRSTSRNSKNKQENSAT